jgi:hypothetical protein
MKLIIIQTKKTIYMTDNMSNSSYASTNLMDYIMDGGEEAKSTFQSSTAKHQP